MIPVQHQTESCTPVGHTDEDGLSTQALRDLLAAPGTSEETGTVDVVCDDIIETMLNCL